MQTVDSISDLMLANPLNHGSLLGDLGLAVKRRGRCRPRRRNGRGLAAAPSYAQRFERIGAALLAQYLQEKGVSVRCFDADPVNSTLAGFPALQTTKLDLIESSDKGRRINPRRFDDLVEHIAGQPADTHVIVDTGSSAFVPLLHYVVSNEVPAVLSQGGHELVVHTVVTGGQALLDTLHGAAQLIKQLDDARFVV